MPFQKLKYAVLQGVERQHRERSLIRKLRYVIVDHYYTWWKRYGEDEYTGANYMGTMPEKHIAEDDYKYLIMMSRVFCTACTMNVEQVRRHVGSRLAQSMHERGLATQTFGWTIITTNPEDYYEAKAIAARRGYGERVVGILDSIIPYEGEDAII